MAQDPFLLPFHSAFLLWRNHRGSSEPVCLRWARGSRLRLSPMLQWTHRSPSAALEPPPAEGSTKELSGEAAARRRSCFLRFCLVVAQRMWVMPFALPVFELAYWCLLGVENCCERRTAVSRACNRLSPPQGNPRGMMPV